MQRLQQQLGAAGSVARDWAVPAAHWETFSCGAAALDRLLPGGGLRHGMLVEWLAGSGSPVSSGTVTLSLLAAREACRQGGVLVVIDEQRMFYPPAAAGWGLDLERLIVAHPRTPRDALWAAVQSLRSSAVAAMWIAINRLDGRNFRRLQLAAGAGRTLGLLLRPVSVRGQPSWADVQLTVGGSRVEERESRAGMQSLDSQLRLPAGILGPHRRIHVHITRVRGAHLGGDTILEIDDDAHTVREAKDHRLLATGYRSALLAESR
jgi:hypothetical protein